MKKTTVFAFLFLFLTTKTYADFSAQILGLESQTDKDFSERNQERLHRGKNEIILTFDDGPTPGVTNKILDILKNNGVKATFFVVAENAAANSTLMKRILDEGHIVANHSLSHQALRDLNFLTWKKTVKKEIIDAHDILAPYMSNGRHFYYRAPEGAWDNKFARYLNQHDVAKDYIGPVLWDIGGEVEMANGQYVKAADWACWSRRMTVDECLTGYINESKQTKGGVVLLHDLRSQSVELVAKLIPSLLDKGFSFRNLDDVNWNR